MYPLNLKSKMKQFIFFLLISFNLFGQISPKSGSGITKPELPFVIAVEQYCATKTNGNSWALVFKGDYADYIGAGGDPNGIYLGTFEPPFDGWAYIVLCSEVIPSAVDGWEWAVMSSPIYGHNGGNTYGECILISNGEQAPICSEKIEIEKIKFSNDSVRYVTNDTTNKWLIDFDITGYTLYAGSCNDNEAKSQSSYVRCYKESGGTASYTDTNNSTDIDFSMNTTEMKYNSGGGDGSDVFTQAIRDCILSGSIAVIQFTDFSGNIYVFEASGITVDAGASGIGTYLFSGTGQASGAAKVKSATLQCGGASSGTAVLCFACGKSGTWYDINTGDTLSEIQVDGLFDCDKECLTESFQLVQCLVDPLPTYGLLAGDYVLYIFEKDCDNVVVSSNWYTVDGLTLIQEIPNVEQCDPQPQIQDIEICFKDSLGVEWKKIAILNGTTIISQVYIKVSDLSTGTPTGLQTSWTSCDACVDWEYKSICVLFNGKGATKKEAVAKEKASTASLGQVLEVCRKEFRDCKTGKFLFYEYEYLGKIYTQTLFDQLGLKQVKCTAPDVKYQPTGDPQCFTSGTNYVYCQLYTDEANVNNTIRTYSYATGGVIADTTGLNLVPCPVGTITSTTTNYWAGAGQEYPYCSQAIVTCVTNVPLGTTKCDTLVDGVVHTGGGLTLNDWSTTPIECPKDTLGFVCTKEPCDSNQFLEVYDLIPATYNLDLDVRVNGVPANGAFYSGSNLQITALFSATPYDAADYTEIVMTGTSSYNGNGFSHDFTNEGTGAYRATVTQYMRSGNTFRRIVTFFWNKSANAFINVQWSNGSYTYYVCKPIFKKLDCKGNNLGYYNADGTAYSIIGSVDRSCPIENEPYARGDSYPIPPLLQTLPVVSPTYSQNRTTFAINTIPASYVVAIPANTREITVQNITGTDFTIATSLGTNTVGTRSSIVMSDPINTTISHVPFSGNLTITALGNVGGNISGQAPRVIVNFKSY